MTKALINVGLPKSAMPGCYPRIPTTQMPKTRHAVYMKRLWNESGYPWRLVPYLVAQSATERVLPASSEARLVFRHGRVKPWDATAYADFEARAQHDWYVCIMSTPKMGASTFGPAGRPWPLWCGIAPARNFHVGGSRYDGIDVIKHGDEHIQAVGLEWLLDRRRLTSAYTRQSDGSSNAMGRMPAFNERLKRGPTYPGNRSESKIEVGGDEVTYGFGSELNAYGLPYQWSLVDIVEYLLYWSDPGSTYEPTFKFTAPDDIGYDLHTYLDGIYDLVRQDRRSVLGVLKALFDRRRGFGARIAWSIDNDSSSDSYGFPAGDVEVQAFSCVADGSTVGSVTFPPNPHCERIPLDEGFDIEDAFASVDSVNTYDRIVVRGAPVVSCFSLRHSIQWGWPVYEKAWLTAREVEYRNEVTTEEEAGTVTADAKRRQSKYERVYATFRLPADFPWSRPDGHTLNPVFDANGEITNWTAVGGYDNKHIRLHNWLPIPSPAATMAESQEANMHKPLALVRAWDPDTWNHWVLTHDIPAEIAAAFCATNARLVPNDREGLLELKFNPPHLLGKYHFDPDTDEAGVMPAFDYEGMYLTIAVEAPAHPTVTVQTGAPPLLGPAPVPILARTLVIDVPEAQVWVVAPGTAIGVNAYSWPEYYSGNRITRDDTDRLRTVAAMAAAVYGKRRTAIRMTKRGLIGGGCLGRVVQSVSIAQEVHDVNSPVTERSWDFERGTTSISTGWVELDVRALR